MTSRYFALAVARMTHQPWALPPANTRVWLIYLDVLSHILIVLSFTVQAVGTNATGPDGNLRFSDHLSPRRFTLLR